MNQSKSFCLPLYVAAPKYTREEWKHLQRMGIKFLNTLKATARTSPTKEKLTELADLFAPYSTSYRIDCDDATFGYINSSVNGSILWMKTSELLPAHLKLRSRGPYAVGLHAAAEPRYQALQAAYLAISFIDLKGRGTPFQVMSMAWSITEDHVSVLLVFDEEFGKLYDKRLAKCARQALEGYSFFNDMPVSTLQRYAPGLKRFQFLDQQWQIIHSMLFKNLFQRQSSEV